MKSSMIMKFAAMAIAFVNAQDVMTKDGRWRAAPVNEIMVDPNAGITRWADENPTNIPGMLDTYRPAFRPDDLKSSIIEAVAEALDMDAEELKTARQEGISHQELAESAGIDLDVVKEAALQNYLNIAVDSGVLTEEQANDVADRFEEGDGKFSVFSRPGKNKKGKKMGKFSRGEKFGGKFGGGSFGRTSKGKGGKFGKGDKIEGLHDAVKQAVENALEDAGFDLPENLTREVMKELLDSGESAGLDLEEIKQSATENFINTAVAEGDISSEQADKYLDRLEDMKGKHADKEQQKELRDSMEEVISSTVSSALGISTEDIEGMLEQGKAGRQQLQQLAETIGLDLKAIRDDAAEQFLQEAVSDGLLSEEQADMLSERKENGRGHKFGRDKSEGNKFSGFRGDKGGRAQKMAQTFGQKFGDKEGRGGNSRGGEKGGRGSGKFGSGKYGGGKFSGGASQGARGGRYSKYARGSRGSRGNRG